MSNHNDIVDPAFKFDRKVQVDGDPWAGVVYHRIVSHAANKWYLVPTPKHTITNPVGGLVSYAVKVFGLFAHDCSI